MALILKDRIKESTTVTGTGDVSLGGSSETFDTFQSVMSNGDTTFYVIVTKAPGVDEWEVGLGTWNTGNTLTRTTVYAGSNGTSAVNFSSGDKDIFISYPANKAVVSGEDVTFADITVTGTVDGRDVAADGTKLDGIESGADVTDTTNVTAAGALMDSEVTNLAQVKAFDSSDYATAAQGALADSAQQPPSEGAFVDGDKTKLDGIEASADVTDTANVTAAGALMDSEVTNLAQVKAFDSSDYATAAQGITADAALPKSGGTMTGNLILNADPTTALGAATKEYVDTIAAAGIHYHTPVRVESPDSAGNLNATYDNGSSGVGATLTNAGTQAALVIDGVTLNTNDRVLIYSQTNAYENGIYTVTNTGSASTNWVLTRATDADSYGASDPNALGEGDAYFVKEGDTGAGELYVMNTSGVITFGTTAITFTVIAETAVYSAGDSLTLTGTTFDTVQDIRTTASPEFAGLTISGSVADTTLSTVSGDNFTINVDGPGGDIILQTNSQDRLKLSSSSTELYGLVSINGSFGDRIRFEGNTADAYETTLRVTEPTADRTITFPDATGTIAFNDVATTSANGLMSSTDKSKLDGVDTSANNYSLPLATSSVRGGVKVGYTENGKNYPVELSSEKMFVNVPWTDTNTTYSAGSGISLSGTTFSHSDTSSQASSNNSGGTVIQDITLDTYGHVTGLNTVNHDNNYIKRNGDTVTYNGSQKALTLQDGYNSGAKKSILKVENLYDFGGGIEIANSTGYWNAWVDTSANNNDLVISGNGVDDFKFTTGGDFYVDRSLYIGSAIYHNGDTNTYMSFNLDRIDFSTGGITAFSIVEGAYDYIELNFIPYISDNEMRFGGFGTSNQTTLEKGANTAARTITLPDADGTVALTTDLDDYVSLAGDTMTGALTIRDTGASTTNTTKTLLTIDHYPSTTPAAGFGAELEFRGKNPLDGASIYGSIVGAWEGTSGAGSGGILQFKTDGYSGGNTTRMTIDSDGNVGIGTVSPSAKLDVSGNIAVSGTLDFNSVTGRVITITGDSGLDSADASIYLGNAPASYGFDITYEGTGSGNTNAFVITSTNAGSPKELIRANQDGIVKLVQSGATVAGNTIFHDGYHPNADKWTTARTLTLSGEASGSVSWDGSADATLSVTLSNTALDDQYVDVTGDSMTGALSISQGTAGTASLSVTNSGGHANNALIASFIGDTDALEIRNDAQGDYKILNNQQNNGISIYDGTGGVKLRYNGSDIAGCDSTGGFEVTSGNLSVTNNINVSGTVDGRDVAADGTKLDGIETGATADQTKADIDALNIDADTVDSLHASSFIRSDADDNVSAHTEWQDNKEIRLGNGADFRMFFDGTDTYLRNYANSGGDIFIEGYGSDGVLDKAIKCDFSGNQSYVQLFQGQDVKLSTTAAGVDITGKLDVSSQLEVGGHLLQDSADRSGLLAISTTLGTWRGIQIQPTTTSKWSIMGDQDDFGLYDDQNNEWIMLYNENSTLQFYANGTNGVNVVTSGIYLPTGKYIAFEGSTSDAFETLLQVADPTADRTITLPNATGTVLLDVDKSKIAGITNFLGR